MSNTEQQQQAIDARDSSIIVSAAAGSGKTYVLTERLLQLIRMPKNNQKGISADKMIVVTFTNDAATEMKSRLDTKLRKLINSDEVSKEERKYLLKQQILLQNAKISTINSFCFELLRDNITEQGITSGFDILDDTANNVIKSQAMEELLDFYSKDKESEEYRDISALYDYFCIKDYKPITKVIMHVDEFLSSVALAEDWLTKTEDEYKKDFQQSVYYNQFFESISKPAHSILDEFKENVKRIEQIFPDMNVVAAKKHKTQAKEELAKVEYLVQLIKDRKFPTADDVEYMKKFNRLESNKNVVCNEAIRDIYKDKRSELKDKFTPIVDSMYKAEDNFNETAQVVALLFKVVRKYREIVWEKKCSKNALSFADGERLALELLIEKDENGRICQSEIAKRIADLYDVIMIDEYQDSNNKQDLIFKLISKNFKYDSDGNLMYGDNVFLVGDMKQSIYGFRLANPKNFKDVMDNSEPYSKDEKSKNQSIFLNENFRSSKETIDFINYIFQKIMTEKCGGIDYSQENEQLHFGAKKYDKAETESRVTNIMLINTDSLETDENDDDEVEVIESPEAEIIADKIAQMIADKVQVVKDDEGATRDCEASDFCILLRKNAFMSIYVKAIQKRGISARGIEEKGYLKSQEVAILIDLLRVIANPLQDVPLTVVMFSPMYMFSLEEIAYIKTKAIDKKDQKIDRKKLMYQVIIEAVNGEIEDFDPQLAEKCRKFVRSLENFRFDSVTMTIGELITSIYDNTDFMSVMQLYKDGEKKRANLRMLIKYAQDYEKFASADGRGGLSGFLRHIDKISEESDYNQGTVPVFSRDYVTVQTLHKSKGLQYPFVFICETSSNFQFDNDSAMCSDDCRIGFILHNKNFVRKYKTFQYNLLKNEKSGDTRSEEMRLLYVGMTRAEQKLFVTLKCGQKSKERLLKLIENCVINDSNISNPVAEANSFSDWLWLCLMMHDKFLEIADCIGLYSDNFGFPAYDESKKLFDIEYFDKIPGVLESDEEKKMPEADSELTEQIKSIIETEYDFTLSETPEKLTVTQILEKLNGNDSKFNSSLERPAFMTEKGATGSERGTAIHTFFQYCSFESAEKDADAEITRLNNNGFLTKVQTDIVRENISKIDAFFRSDLYIRIKSAVKSGKCEREKKFLVKFSDLQKQNTVFENIINSDSMIKGVVDLIYEEDDGLVIVDYKSDKVYSADTLIKSYSNQLEFYKLAVELITGKKVKALVIYSVELEKAIEIAL